MDETAEGWGAVAKFLLAGVQYFGWWVVFGGFICLLIFWRLDQLKNLFSGRHVEREQNWDEAQDIMERQSKEIERLTQDVERQRTWRAQEAADYEKLIAKQRTEISILIQTVASSEKGNSRLRHALNNVCTIDGALRRTVRNAGVTVKPFPLDTLMELDDEWGARLRDIMREFC